MLNDGKQCRYEGKRSRWYVAPARQSDMTVDTLTLQHTDGDVRYEIQLQGQSPIKVRTRGFDWYSIDDINPDIADVIRQHYTTKYVLQYPVKKHR